MSRSHVIPDGDYTLIISQSMLMQIVADYVNMIETAETRTTCKCEWIIHPDDTEITDGCCRICNHGKDADAHTDEPYPFTNEHEFKGKRMRRGDAAMDCPVHTKEGFLLGFFEWLAKQAD